MPKKANEINQVKSVKRLLSIAWRSSNEMACIDYLYVAMKNECQENYTAVSRQKVLAKRYKNARYSIWIDGLVGISY